MKIKFGEELYVVPQIAQYTDITHSKLLMCKCGRADYANKYSYDIIGYVDTPAGFMIVCECPHCFDKYRHHVSSYGRYDIEIFKKDLGLKLHLKIK